MMPWHSAAGILDHGKEKGEGVVGPFHRDCLANCHCWGGC